MDAPYFPFYPADWLADTNVQVMTLEERGAYIHLLAHMWREDGCSLPDDDKFLAKLLHVSSRKWINLRKSLVDGLQAVFEKKSDGRLHNSRLDKEYGNYMKKSQSRSNAAKSRWSKDEDEDANAMQMHSKSSASAPVLHMQNDAISESESDTESESLSEKDKAASVKPPISPTEIQSVADEVEGELRALMGNPNYILKTDDYHALVGLLKEKVSVEQIKLGIKDAFERYRPKHNRDRIHTFTYCVGSILDRVTTEQAAATGVSIELSANRKSRGSARLDKSEVAAADERYGNFYRHFPERGSG